MSNYLRKIERNIKQLLTGSRKFTLAYKDARRTKTLKVYFAQYKGI